MNRVVTRPRARGTAAHISVAAVIVVVMLGSPRVGLTQESVPTAEQEDAQRPVFGKPTGFTRTAEALHRLAPGDRLRTGPRESADVAVQVPAGVSDGLDALVTERRTTDSGEWLRLRWAGVVGWLQVARSELPPDGAAAVLGDAERMARRGEVADRALSELGGSIQPRVWQAPFNTTGTPQRRSITVWTDLDPPRRDRLKQLAECLPRMYAQRYGDLTAAPQLALEVVVFADRDAYERFASANTTVAGGETSGFELDGLVIVAADADMEVNFLGTAAHELAHALNRLWFWQESPAPWVEEGIAEDMAHSVEAAFISGKGLCRRPGDWSRTQVTEAVVMENGEAHKETRLLRSARARTLLCYPSPVGVDDLLDADRLEFVTAIDRRWKYVEALLLVRSLLEEPVSDRRSQLLEAQIGDPEREILRLLGVLDWRADERALLDC